MVTMVWALCAPFRHALNFLCEKVNQTLVLSTHTQTQIMHANQIQYFRVLHIIKSILTACSAGGTRILNSAVAGHFKKLVTQKC